MARHGPFMGGMGGAAQEGQTAAPAGGKPQPKAGGKPEVKKEEEKKKDKTHYDIELTKFEPAKKIALIKEVRAFLGLGLKEAKDMVEAAPVWIKKEMKKEDAEKLAEKLKTFGGVCRLA